MTSPAKSHPVIFIHGLWIHSTAWQPRASGRTRRGTVAGPTRAPPAPANDTKQVGDRHFSAAAL